MKKVGIVGGGISGLTCAYKLQHDFDVTLFEKEQQLGGHARTTRVDGSNTEAAVSVVAEMTYVEFFKLMGEIGFDDFKSYNLDGLLAHDRKRIDFYLDSNLKRLAKLYPKYLLNKPQGVLNTLQLLPFLNRLYADYRSGKLDDKLVLDAYTLYPGYRTLISTVLSILSLITSVQLKNSTIKHVLNFAFDFENNQEKVNPLVQILKLFKDVTVPEGGVGAYIEKLAENTQASFITGGGIQRVTRNSNGTVTVATESGKKHIFDAVIVASQPFHVSDFLEYKNSSEAEIFNRLENLVTHSLVTNHRDKGIYEGVSPVDGLVDFRMDHHENTSQTTIDRGDHYYTAQILPENFKALTRKTDGYYDTGFTPDNYSIARDKILTQYVHAVQHMTQETSDYFEEINGFNGEDNLYFCCAALSKYPTSQEGGVRSALNTSKEIMAWDKKTKKKKRASSDVLENSVL